MKKFLIKLILGLVVAGFFTWLAGRGLSLSEVITSLKHAHIRPIFFMAIVQLITSVLRSLRWQLVLAPIERLHQRILYPISSVGYMAASFLPARIGELTKPYLLSVRSQISMSTALSTVLLERILDALTVVGLLTIALILKDLPSAVKYAGKLLGVAAISALLLLMAAYFKQDFFKAIIDKLISFIPLRFRKKFQAAFVSFITGMSIITNWKRMLLVIILTLIIWATMVVSFYILFGAFEMTLPPSAAIVGVSITALGIALPTAPGFVGSFHYFCMFSLTLFGVEKELAVSYAVLNHLISIGMILVIGLICMPLVKVGSGGISVVMKRHMITLRK